MSYAARIQLNNYERNLGFAIGKKRRCGVLAIHIQHKRKTRLIMKFE